MSQHTYHPDRKRTRSITSHMLARIADSCWLQSMSATFRSRSATTLGRAVTAGRRRSAWSWQFLRGGGHFEDELGREPGPLGP